MIRHVHRAAGLLRTELFPVMDREKANKVVINYTGHVPDPRLDAHAIDMLDASLHYLGGTHHYVVTTEGRIEVGRDPRTRSSRTRTKRYHREAIFVGIVGGLAADNGHRIATITEAQNEAGAWLLQALADNLGVELEVIDHVENWNASRDLNSKDHAKALRSEILELLYANMTDDEIAMSEDRITA